MTAGREAKCEEHFSLLYIFHSVTRAEWGRGREGGPVALTLGGGAFGMHTKGKRAAVVFFVLPPSHLCNDMRDGVG